MADATDLKSVSRKGVRVQFPPSAFFLNYIAPNKLFNSYLMAPFTCDPAVINEVSFPRVHVYELVAVGLIPKMAQKLWDIKDAFSTDGGVNFPLLIENKVAYWGIFNNFQNPEIGEILVFGEVEDEGFVGEGEYPARLPSEIDALMGHNLEFSANFECGDIVIPTIQRGDENDGVIRDKEIKIRYQIASLKRVLEELSEKERRTISPAIENMRLATEKEILEKD